MGSKRRSRGSDLVLQRSTVAHTKFPLPLFGGASWPLFFSVPAILPFGTRWRPQKSPDLQCDVLNQQHSLLAPVEVQLRRLSPALEVTSMAQSHAFQFTSSSHNSILYPASLPYAYPVPSLCLLPRFVLPNFGFLFDILIKPNKFAPHSGRMSTLSPAFADLITHSIFNTSRWPDWIVNDANNYLYSNVSLGIHLEKPKWYFLHYFTLFYKKNGKNAIWNK